MADKVNKAYILIIIFTKPKYKIGKNQKIYILSTISDDKVVSKKIFDITALILYLLLSLL